MSLFDELKRRNVLRVATAYLVASWLIIQVAETILPAYGFGGEAIRLIISLLAIAFVPVLVFSWVFEITPEGLQRERSADERRDDRARPATRLDRVILVLLALALGYFAFDKFIIDPVRDRELAESVLGQKTAEAPADVPYENSIAVLPFVNMSADPDQDYFSDGIAEELLGRLAKVPGLRVISRSSAFSFRGLDLDIPEIARRLRVAAVLEGSVRKSGERVRISAQLIDAREDIHLWSEVYDRTLGDIFSIQDDIASQVVEALKTELLPQSSSAADNARPTDDLAAYQDYLRGRHQIARRTRESLELALAAFRAAVERDPDFAEAWAGVADSLTLMAIYGFKAVGQIRADAEHAIDTALGLEPDLDSAHASRGLLWSQLDVPDSAVSDQYRKALALNPNNSLAHMWLSNHLLVAEPEAAGRHIQRAYELDPLSGVVVYNLAEWMVATGRFEAARSYAEELLRLDPDWPAAHRLLGAIAITQGDAYAWFRANLHTVELDPEDVTSLGNLANGYVSVGDLEMAARYAGKMLAIAPSFPNSVAMQAYLMDLQGDSEGALQLVNDLLARYPDDRFALSQVIFMEAHIGRPERALALCRRNWNSETPPAVPEQDDLFSNTAPCAHALLELGFAEEAAELSVAGIAAFEGMGGSMDTWQRHFMATRLALAVGDRPTALVELDHAERQGLTPVGVFPLESWMQPYRNDPDFEPYFDRLDQQAEALFRRLSEDGLVSQQRRSW